MELGCSRACSAILRTCFRQCTRLTSGLCGRRSRIGQTLCRGGVRVTMASSFRKPALLFCVVLILSLFMLSNIRHYSNSSYVNNLIFIQRSRSKANAHLERLVQHAQNQETVPATKEYYIVVDWTPYTKFRRMEDFIVDDACLITRNKSKINVSSAIVVTIRRQKRIEDFPHVRFPWQRWVWLNDERPFHTLPAGKKKHNYLVKDLAGMFNWTMTHRLDSDVPIPYGYTFRDDSAARLYNVPIGDVSKRYLVAGMISNGMYVYNGRLRYIKKLNETVNVDLYGQCGSYNCSGYIGQLPGKLCPKLKNYLFFLSFENSNCRDYITEKFFLNALTAGAVPVVMGANKTSYEQLAPPDSFIHVSDFHSPKDLGNYLLRLQENLSEYMAYHAWRGQYAINYRLQYLDNKIWFPLCQALKNDDGKTKVYNDINDWWSVQRDCEPHVPEN